MNAVTPVFACGVKPARTLCQQSGVRNQREALRRAIENAYTIVDYLDGVQLSDMPKRFVELGIDAKKSRLDDEHCAVKPPGRKICDQRAYTISAR